MTVRRLDKEDAAAYQELRLRALQECPTAFSSSYEEECRRPTSEIVARVTEAPDGFVCVFGAFDHDRLVGILAFVRSRGAKTRHIAELAGMYVVPECRHQGHGRALVDILLLHARSAGGVRSLKLGVNAQNEPAKRLYQAVGFRYSATDPEAILVEGRYYDEETYLLRLADPD
jgi:ribosomal protein S18 acetylase RimI-like enzyme